MQQPAPGLWNFRLLAQHALNGFGGMGEGLAIQIAKDGRRILWCAHESAPKNFTAVDVSDPRAPKVVCQTELPQPYMRSNSLELTGDILCVAYQTRNPGQQPAGFEVFDISRPEAPRSISVFDCSGPWSRGVHQLWFCDGETVHLAAGAPDFQPRNAKDDQCYRIIDLKNPSKPTEVGRWWMPGTREGDAAPPPPRHRAPALDSGFRAHNTNVYPQRPDRCYLGYLDAGMFILDIADRSDIKVVSRWDNSPPYPGFTHTVLPLFERNLLVVSDESVRDNGEDWAKLIWILDGRDETNPVPISTCPMPPLRDFAGRGGRFGAHNLHENVPLPTCWFSDQVVVGTFFNGGLRAFDIADPYAPREIAHFVPEAPRGSPVGSIQINDVFIDERGVVYTVDRHTGGLYTLEMEF
ncbi:MAG: hypothetical protein K2X74_16340 [Acetobacteraceae bacterium]|nr:hypothetical protein [Acetobacteraceae bacterium]